ncbi:MAG: ABC transporter ATP-binding protein [Bacteroidota bacterium]
MEKVIQIEHLSKAFGSNEVFKDINLELEKGENKVILGKSGIGKSVLAKCIVGLIESDSGKILVFDKNIPDLENDELDEIRRKVGYLFQGGALYDSMSVRENLKFPIRRTQMSKHKDEVESLIEEALSSVGLLDVIDKMPSELSGGMRKRVGLARTIIRKPQIILYDEPTTGLDPVTSGEISELLLSIQEKYKTSSIIITHDMKCARITGNKLALIRSGIIFAQGTYEDMANSDDKSIRAYFN